MLGRKEETFEMPLGVARLPNRAKFGRGVEVGASRQAWPTECQSERFRIATRIAAVRDWLSAYRLYFHVDASVRFEHNVTSGLPS